DHARRLRHAAGWTDRRRRRHRAGAVRAPGPLEARGGSPSPRGVDRVPSGGAAAGWSGDVILGLLPELRGGLGALARSGQHTRFVASYLRPYARAFDEVRLFSYLQETLADFTTDRELAARIRVVAGAAGHPWLTTTLMGLRHGRALAGCSVLRVFHLTGVVPALVARRRFGVPFVVTYGFRYDRLARAPARAGVDRRPGRLGRARGRRGDPRP